MPKKIRKKKYSFFSTLLNVKKIAIKYSYVLVWSLAILFIISSVNRYLEKNEETDVHEYNLKQIKKNNLEKIFKQKKWNTTK